MKKDNTNNTNNSKNELNNPINKISTKLNNNIKDLIIDTNLKNNFNKKINKENKEEKVIRKNKFISDNNLWDNITGNLMEDNYYYFYQNVTKDKYNKLNRNFGKNINNNNINTNNLMKFNKKWLIKSINDYKQKNTNLSNKFDNDIQTNKFNSRLSNNLENNNSLNKSSNFKNNIRNNSSEYN